MTVRWKRSPRQHGEDAYPILHIFLTTDFRVQPVVSMETVLTEQLSNVLTVKINVNESSSFGRLYRLLYACRDCVSRCACASFCIDLTSVAVNQSERFNVA